MATQTNNLLLVEDGVTRTLDAANDALVVGPEVTFSSKISVGAGLNVTGDTKIDGDLQVTGTIVSTNEESLVIKDAFIDLGLGNTTTSVQAGGFALAMNRVSASVETAETFVAGVGAPTNTPPSFTTSAASSLAAGDMIAISGAADANNDGLYVVASVVGSTVTIKGVGGTSPSASVPFVQNQFTAGTAQSASVYKVAISAAAFASGGPAFKDGGGNDWPAGAFITTKQPYSIESDFTANGAYDTAAQTSLQEAYEVGATITTSAAEGQFTVAGDQTLVVSSTGGLQVSGGALNVDTSADFDLTGAFTVDGGQAVQVGSGSAVSTFTVDATGAISLDSAAASNFTTSSGALTLSGAGGVTVTSTGGTLALNGSGQTVDLDAATLDVDGGAMSFDGSEFNVGVAQDIPVVFEATTYGITASGAFTAEAGAASTINTTAGDLTLDAEAASLILDGGEAASDAVKIHASNAAGGIDIDAGTAGIAVDSTGVISLDAADLSNFTVATTADAQDLVLAVTGATNSSVLINSSGTGADAVAVTASAGGFTVDAVGAISLDSTATASNFSLSANDAGTATLTIAASNTGDGVANLDIDADGAITIDGASFSVDSTSASNMTVTGGNLTVSTVTSGVLAVTSAGNLDMDAVGTVTLDSSGGSISIGSNADAYGINIGTGAAARTITVGNTTGATALDVNLGTGGMTVDTQSGGAISLDAVGAASNFTVDGGNLTLSTLTSGNLIINSVQLLNVDAGTDVEIDAQLGISLDSKKLSNFTVTAANENLNIGVVGGGTQQLILGSAGTGVNAVRVNASAGGIDIDAAAGGITVDTTGSLSLEGAANTDLTLNGNNVADYVLLVESKNANTGKADLTLKAKTSINIGDVANNTGVISNNHFVNFSKSGGMFVEAGETIVAGDAVMAKWDAVNSKIRYYKASNAAATDAERNVYGVAVTGAGAAGNFFQMHSVAGLKVATALADTTSADIGKTVYLGTGGALTLIAPSGSGKTVFKVGYLVVYNAFVGVGSPAEILFQPQFIAKIP